MLAFCDLKSQYLKYKNEIDERIQNILNNSSFIGGAEVALLEENLANFVKSKYAYSCSNGTSALYIALKALGIKEGDEIITSPFTFIASSEMIALIGAKPVFVDISDVDYNLDISKIEEKISPKTKAILAISIFGQMPDLNSLKKICKKHNLYLIEDAAQSFGARNDLGEFSCNIADISTTSFFPSKPLGCYGDGGAIFTNNDELAKKVKLLINHGSEIRYQHEIIGLNARLDAIQAAVLNVKLKYFDEEITKRVNLANTYSKNLKNCITPQVKANYLSVWAQYSVRVKNRDLVIKKLNENGIPTAIHYPIALYKQPCFKYLEYNEKDFKVCEDVTNEILSLPFSAFLDIKDQEKIIEIFNKGE